MQRPWELLSQVACLPWRVLLARTADAGQLEHLQQLLVAVQLVHQPVK